MIPNGWIHNLEHGGMVVLYSCDKGACDDATLQRLQGIVTDLPASADLPDPPGVLAPVVARFEQMPTKFAALVWDRVMYMDMLDEARSPRSTAAIRSASTARATGSRRPSSSATRPRRAPARARARRRPMAPAQARPRPARRARAPRRRRRRPSRARPRAEAGAVRLYAYEDRSGDPTFGVLIADRLLTSGQLMKHGPGAS